MSDHNIALNAFLNAHDTVLQINLDTTNILVLKSVNHQLPNNTSSCVDEFMQRFFDIRNIHPDDAYKFRYILSIKELQKKASAGDSGALFSFRHYSNDRYHWIRLDLMIPDNYGNDNPYVLLCTKYLTVANSDMTEVLEAYSQHIYKVVKCNLTTNVFRIIKQRTSELYIHRPYIKQYILNKEWHIEEALIHPDDLDRFRYYTDHDLILKHFSSSSRFLSCFYRRKIGSIYKWVRLSILPSTEYSDSNKIFTYIIEDVDRVLYNLLEKQIRFQYQQKELPLPEMNVPDIYFENMNYIMSYFTERYIDCYLINLKMNQYTLYKINPKAVAGDLPYTGSYSALFSQYILPAADPSIISQLDLYADVQSLKELLKDKASIEYLFQHKDGRLLKILYTKLESENGVPTKVVCCALPYSSEGLLKVKTFGNFNVYDSEGHILHFKKKQSKQLLAYLIDRQGFPVSPKDIAVDVLEKDANDLNAIKYISTLARLAIKDLEAAGYTEIIIKEWNSLRINVDKLDCDYYHLIGGDTSYYHLYHNEYMKEYSWAEETNAEILHLSSC